MVLFIYFAATTTAFFSHGSFVNIDPVRGAVRDHRLGVVLLMICGEIDLSVGFIYARRRSS